MYRSKVNLRASKLVTDLDTIKSAVRCGRVAAVDQFGVQSFGLNDAGWPRNTISLLDRCQTIEQYKLLQSRLVEQPVKSDKSNLPLRERFALIRPRYVQTPFECEMFARELANMDMAKIDDAYDKALQRELDSSAPASSSSSDSASADK